MTNLIISDEKDIEVQKESNVAEVDQLGIQPSESHPLFDEPYSPLS